MKQDAFMVGTLVQPVMVVRAGQDPALPHVGTLTIDDWTIPCVIGRGGLSTPDKKREGDGCTPIGRFPLRYGFYDPDVFGAEMAQLPFPLRPKPANYDWSESPNHPFYNRMTYDLDEARPSRLGERLFDLFIPIGWNDAQVVPSGGSAIFFHAARPEFTPTAGCVAVAHDQLLEVARRLRPGMMVDIAAYDPNENRAQGVLPVREPVIERPTMMESVTFHGLRSGPRVIVTGGVHGNESAGPKAIERLIGEFRAGLRRLDRGSVTFVPVVNGLAWRKNTRNGDRNLNRDLGVRAIAQDYEDQIGNVLCPLLAAHDVLIDLHSFHAEGSAFALIGPENNHGGLEPFAHADEEAALARALGLPMVVHGWMAAHEKMIAQKRAAGVAETALATAHGVGTTEYMRFKGGYAVTVECGQHQDPNGPQVGYDVVLRGLAHLGLIAPLPEETLPAMTALELHEAVLADHPDDRLVREFRVGENVRKGDVIGKRADGSAITAPYDGAVIFASLNADTHSELCFLAQKSKRF